MEENLSLEEQIEKLKEENEKLKLTHTKIEEKLKWYINKVKEEDYRFDSSETWDIESVLIKWIYSRFKWYKEICNVNLDWRGIDNSHCFPLKENEEEKLITQREAIDFVLDRCEEYIKDDSDDKSKYLKLFDDDFWVLFGKLLPAMWW